MIVLDQDLGALPLRIERDLFKLGRSHSVLDVGLYVVTVTDDIDLFTPELAHNTFDTLPADTHTGANTVDLIVRRGHGDLGAGSGLTCHGLDLHEPVVDLRHFHFKELRHKIRMCSR